MEDEIAPAPQSIVIQAGTPAPTEIATAPPEQVEAQTEGPTPTATSASGVSKEAVETYITVMNVKDNSNGTAVLAAIFLFFIPLLFGISFLENFDDGGSCFLCLGSMGIGTVFAIMSVTESNKNQQNQKNAKLRIIEEAGLHSPSASKIPLYVGGTSLAVLVLSGFLSDAFYDDGFEIINGLMNIFGLLGLLISGALYFEREHKRKKTINQLVNVIVDKETKKPGT